jgi:hypothetical protein
MIHLFVLLQTGAPAASATAQLAPEIRQSLSMRESWHVDVPHCQATIYEQSVAVHHIRTDQSTIACRDDNGIWTISQIAQDGPGGLLAIQKSLVRRTEVKPALADARKLDGLLSRRSLYSEVVRRTGRPEIGAPFHVMQIFSAAGSVVVRWNGRLLGRLGQVADIVLGKAGRTD